MLAVNIQHVKLYFRSPMKLAMERQKQAFKAGWLTSPNTYKKQEIEEIGTSTPKKITKVCAYSSAEYTRVVNCQHPMMSSGCDSIGTTGLL